MSSAVDLDKLYQARRRTEDVLAEVYAERIRQTDKHGDQGHLPLGTGPELLLDWPGVWDTRAREVADWAKARCKAASQNEGGNGTGTFEHILTEEWAEFIAEDDPARARAEAIQIAAVAVQIVEAIDRRRGGDTGE